MAAGGGTFTSYNKVLPGAYINFVSKARALGTIGERGTVAVPFDIDWGEEDKVIEISAEDFQKNSMSILGYEYASEKLLYLRELFKGANTVKLYRLGTGKKAECTIGELTVTAKYSGKRGNSIRIVIAESVDNEGEFTVKTFLGLSEVDEQTVSDIKELNDNDFVCFSGKGEITETAGTTLENGSNDEVTGEKYSKFLDKIESEEFTTLCYAGDNSTTKGLFAEFTKRLRDEEGYKISCVLYDYAANHEGVINVKNCSEAVYWVAGQTAGAEVNQSLTNMLYNGELHIDTAYKKSRLKEALQKGEFVFYGEKDEVRVLKDINSFTEITAEKNSDFGNNQIIRVIDSVANDVAAIFNRYYLGKVQNNEVGRDLFKSELISYHEQLQAIGAITNFSGEDIEISKGKEKGDVIVNEYIEPVGAMDKLYMSCIVV